MKTVELHLREDGGRAALSLSGVVADGPDHLFVAPDEGRSVVRLRRHGDEYRWAGDFAVDDLVSVAGPSDGEIDLEGLDLQNGFLWLLGSHSAVRTRVRDSTPAASIPALLAEVTEPAARRLLARVPVVQGSDGPEPVTSARLADGKTVHAASLVESGLHAALHDEALLGGRHIRPFLGLPGKDNGLDIEGIAAVGTRILLGLRGPVLRGWAVVIEIELRESADQPGRLELAPLTEGSSEVVALHFLELGGLGIRDLARWDDDLLILAGPTMLLDGPSRVLRLPGAGSRPLATGVRAQDMVQVGADLRVVPDPQLSEGEDHPEGITVLRWNREPRLLVVYDSPSDARARTRDDMTRADLFRLE